MKFLGGFAHLFVRGLHVIKLFLLFRGEQRPDLRHGGIHHGFGFLHRFLVDRLDLRFGLIENRLNLGLLIRRQVQRLGHMLEVISVTVPSMPTATLFVSGLRDSEAAERNRAGGCKCK